MARIVARCAPKPAMVGAPSPRSRPSSSAHATPARARPALVAVDLFCGAGALSYAFHLAGVRILAAVEKDENAANSYKTSFVDVYSPGTKLLIHDIRGGRVTGALRALRDAEGKVDIVIGGPPCQDFSPARLKARRNGHRAGLVRQYFKILQLLDPSAFLFENVPGMQKAADGKYWAIFEEEANELGYTVRPEVLHAEDFGVPQRRHRLFVVGLKTAFGAFAFPSGREEPPSVMETIGGLPKLRAGEVSPTDPMHRARCHLPKTVEYLSMIPQGGSWRQAREHRVLECHQDHDGHYDVYGRMKADDIAPTITGGCTNPSKGRFIHPEQDRGLTVREAALLQSFPEDWSFCGGIEAASLQVGNAVPVKLGLALAKSLRYVLTEKKPHKATPSQTYGFRFSKLTKSTPMRET